MSALAPLPPPLPTLSRPARSMSGFGGQGGGVFGPRFFLQANGQMAVDLIPYISRFEYEDGDGSYHPGHAAHPRHKRNGHIDSMKLTVLNPGQMFTNDPRFLAGASYAVRFGYVGNLSEVKYATIAHARPSYPQNGIPTIQLVAYDLSSVTNRTGNATNYGVVASDAVAQVIAKRYGFSTDIEASKDARAQARVQTADTSDYQYLSHLAAKLNWDFYVEGTTLHFHSKRFDMPAEMEFVYYTDATGTLLNFEPDVNMNAPPGTGAAGTSNQTAQTTQKNASTTSQTIQVNVQNKTVGPVITTPNGSVARNPGTSGLTLPSAESDARVVDLHGAAIAQRIDMAAIKASAEMVGNPQVKSRIMIRISGVGQQYTGNWRVGKSTHVIEPKGVYKTHVGLLRDLGNANGEAQNRTTPNGTGSSQNAKVKTVNVTVNAQNKTVSPFI